MPTYPPPESRPIVITEIEQFGGAERSVIALSRWLHQHSLPNHVVVYSDRCDLSSYAAHSMQVIQLKPAPGVRHKIAAMRLYFEQHPGPKPLLSGYQPALHATLAGVRGFHTLMHDTPSLFGDQNLRSLTARLRITVSNRIIGHGLRSGGATIVTSEYLRNECRKDFKVSACVVRMGGLSSNASIQPARQIHGRLRLLSVSRIEANKRIDWIIRSLAELEHDAIPLSSRIDWQIDLVGEGSLIPTLRKSAEDLGIGNRVRFHGFVSDGDLEQFFAQANLFLMPAVQGYGIPAIESLQRGIPVLLHRESGVSDILLDTPWATVINGGKDDMTPALRSAIDSAIDSRHHSITRPDLPTEGQWAEQVANLCNWL